MSKPSYNRKKVRRALLISPAIGLLGILPFFFQLNLTFMQFLIVGALALVVTYITAMLFGTPGYLILRHFGYSQTRYLMTYAVVLVAATPFILDDVYALVSLGPPALLGAGAFCYIRGSVIDAAENPNEA